MRVFVKKGLILIFKRGEDIYRSRVKESEDREDKEDYSNYR